MHRLDRLEEWVITVLMGMATLIIFVAVVHRYAMGVPALYPYLFAFNTSWAQELCIFLFVWMAKFGAAYGVRTGIHVGVDVVVNQMQNPLRNRVIVLGLSGGVLFTAIIGSLGGYLVWKLFHTDQTSADLEMPMWLVYLCVPLGSGLMCFRFIQVIRRFIHSGQLPHHDDTEVEGMDVHDLEQEAIVHHVEQEKD
ncbi:MAG: TRAP transporter small permease [Magnetococcales bacterium]|nr:TRAP transporter small permease [Magnetococcales bacterium]